MTLMGPGSSQVDSINRPKNAANLSEDAEGENIERREIQSYYLGASLVQGIYSRRRGR
jgi:hypothetical protein